MSVGTPNILTEFLVIIMLFWANVGTVPRLGHGNFLPNTFQLSIHMSP